MKPLSAVLETSHSPTRRDTYISTMGGVSEGAASTLPNRANVPGGPSLGLLIIEANVDHDGEPMIGWEWGPKAADQIHKDSGIFPDPLGLGSTEDFSPTYPVRAGSLTLKTNISNITPINGVPGE